MILMKGLTWHKSDVALKKLKEMLWEIEALRVFDDKLRKALENIQEADKKMGEKLKRVGLPICILETRCQSGSDTDCFIGGGPPFARHETRSTQGA
jgi:hypothetical protein